MATRAPITLNIADVVAAGREAILEAELQVLGQSPGGPAKIDGECLVLTIANGRELHMTAAHARTKLAEAELAIVDGAA